MTARQNTVSCGSATSGAVLFNAEGVAKLLPMISRNALAQNYKPHRHMTVEDLILVVRTFEESLRIE